LCTPFKRIAVGKIRIRIALFIKDCIRDPNACKLQVLLIAVLSLLLSVLRDKEGIFYMNAQTDIWKNGAG